MNADEDPSHSMAKMPTIAFQTVGCKLNQSETESMSREFGRAGYKVVSPSSNPDIFVLNTCTVTHIADRKCRQYLRSFHKRNPDSLVAAVGCYSDRDLSSLNRIQGVDITIGNADKDRLVQLVDMSLATRGISRTCNSGHTSTSVFRTRSQVKVQAGCNQHCSYCIVPKVRGIERSVPPDAVIDQIKARAEEGFQEVVLTGTRIGAYDHHGGLEQLTYRILQETGIPRLRLSSMQPNEISSSLINLFATEDRLCRHLHLALQSGSDSVLQRMGRSYSADQYREATSTIRYTLPDVAITTDIIVGFPGETEQEFEESYQFCEEIGFSGLHVFPFSARPETPAARMTQHISQQAKKNRSRIMLDLANRSAGRFRSQFSGKNMPVLWEEQKTNNVWIGHTGNYIKVLTRNNGILGNCITNTKLGVECDGDLWGEVCHSHLNQPIICSSQQL